MLMGLYGALLLLLAAHSTPANGSDPIALRWSAKEGKLPLRALDLCLRRLPSGLRCQAFIQETVSVEGGPIQLLGLDGGMGAIGAPAFSKTLADQGQRVRIGSREFRARTVFPSDARILVIDFADAMSVVPTRSPGYDWMEVSGSRAQLSILRKELGIQINETPGGFSEGSAVEALTKYSYRIAEPGRHLSFPKDHGAHRDSAFEWWYFTGHLFGKDGKEVAGFQVMVCRSSPGDGPFVDSAVTQAAGRPEGASFLVADLAITDLRGKAYFHHSYGLRERVALASVSDSGLAISLPGVSIRMDPGGQSIELSMTAELSGKKQELRGTLTSKKPLAVMGDAGYSRKGNCPTCATYYTSFTRLEGELSLNRNTYRAQAWFDHEFGTHTLGGKIEGWDWFSLQLEGGWELMAFQTRSKEDVFRSGAWVDPGGKVFPISAGSLSISALAEWTSPVTRVKYPSRWKLRASAPPGSGRPDLEVEIVPRLPSQEFVPGKGGNQITYWEGTSEVLGPKGKSLGTAYVELNGYDPEHLPKF